MDRKNPNQSGTKGRRQLARLSLTSRHCTCKISGRFCAQEEPLFSFLLGACELLVSEAFADEERTVCSVAFLLCVF